MHDPDVLFEEAAFIAYYFGWGHDEVLQMEHWERQRWCEEISSINEELDAGAPTEEQPEEDEIPLPDMNPDDGGDVFTKSLEEIEELSGEGNDTE